MLVASGDQLETIDRLFDEGTDRFVVKMVSDAAHDLPAHLFRHVEDFEQRADSFVDEVFEFDWVGYDGVGFQMRAVV